MAGLYFHPDALARRSAQIRRRAAVFFPIVERAWRAVQGLQCEDRCCQRDRIGLGIKPAQLCLTCGALYHLYRAALMLAAARDGGSKAQSWVFQPPRGSAS